MNFRQLRVEEEHGVHFAGGVLPISQYRLFPDGEVEGPKCRLAVKSYAT